MIERYIGFSLDFIFEPWLHLLRVRLHIPVLLLSSSAVILDYISNH